MIGLCTSPDFCKHQTGPDHPERPDRIRAIFEGLRGAGLVDSPNPLPPLNSPLGPMPPAEFKLQELTPAPAERKWIETIHPPAHIDRIQHICRIGGVLDQGDTPVGPASFDVALLSTGALLTCCDAVIDGSVLRAFAAVRPPGHHAEPAASMGFCLFSNVAIAARYLQKRHGVGKVAIVDFDVHHGNGTQAAFEDDPSVLFFSIHQDPRTCYPGSGYDWEVGSGPGTGFTLNIPMSPGAGDSEWLAEFDGRILPRLDDFKPEFLLLSAGFDGHAQDPLASTQLTEDGFGRITRRMVAAANTHCRGKLVSALEGGYHLPALARSVVRHVMELRD
jgi:acetoin utilization deacetylase AcuC-like enzyme